MISLRSMGKRRSGKTTENEIEALKRDLARVRTKGDMKEVSNIHNRIGILYRELGLFQEALQEHEDEAEVTRRYFPNDKLGLGVALRAQGEVYIEMKEEEKALPFIKDYLRLSKEISDFVEEQRAHVTIGRVYLGLALGEEEQGEKERERLKNLARAEKHFLHAKQLTNHVKVRAAVGESGVIEMLCGVFLNLYLVLDASGRAEDSMSYLLKAVEMAEKNSLHESLYRGRLALYDLHIRKKKWKEALECAEAAVKAAKSSSNKVLLAEAEFSLGKTHFLQNPLSKENIDKGISILKVLRKKGNFSLEELDPVLKTTIRIRRTEEKLAIAEGEKEKLRLTEIQGDKLVQLTNYEAAAKYYKQALKAGEELGIGNKKKAALLFSLAETLSDLGEYNEGRKYFMEELSLHKDNPSEAFKTQTRLCLLLEKGAFLSAEVEKAYRDAIQSAKRTSNPHKESVAFTNYALYLRKIGKSSEADEATRQADELKKNVLDEEEVDSQDLLGEGDDSSVSGSSIDLQELSSDDESDEETVKKTTTSMTRKKFRVNEKGETPLHVAAKKGDLKAVRRLLRQGHEINPRDSAGWIPLHEAANFGHLEVVEELLNCGARLNDQPVGRDCDKITPLHDAASNGHLDLVCLFVRRGADLSLKDAQGNLPMDTLVAAHEGAKGNLSEEDSKKWTDTLNLLRKKMEKKRILYTKQEEEAARKRGRKLLLSGRESPTEFALRGKGEKMPVRVALDDFDPEDADAAVDLYSKTIKGLRGKKKRESWNEDEREEHPTVHSETGALIPETDYVDEDWLEDDMRSGGRKRRRVEDTLPDRPKKTGKEKRNDVALLDFGGHSSRGAFSLRDSSSESEPEPFVERQKSPSPPFEENEPVLPDIIDVSSHSSSEDERSPAVPKRKPNKPVMKQTKLTSGFTRILTPSEHRSPVKSSRPTSIQRAEEILRLRISIGGKVFGVPLLSHQSEESIQWLCQEASRRYFESEGLCPILRLRTKEGALLSGTDVIRVAVGGSETELEGEIISFDLPRLSERFREAVSKSSGSQIPPEEQEEIVRILDTTQSSDVLAIRNKRLAGPGLRTPLLTALQCQFGLREINLRGCSLFDEGVKALSGILHTLPSLQTLNLSQNGLSSEALNHLSNAIRVNKQQNQQAFRQGLEASRGLTSLDLSFNPFGSSAGGPPLCQLLAQLDHLRKLYLVDTDISAQTIRESTLLQLLSRLKLEELDLRYNEIGENENKLFFQAGAFDLIQKLNNQVYDPLRRQL